VIDSLDIKARNSDVPGIDFLCETPRYFDVAGEHNFRGEPVITGTLDNFKITVNRGGINITEGSLCKWYLGDNFQTLGRGDIQRAIEKMSDTLHLPVGRATVTRLDIAQNFIVKQPVEVYYNHLGEMKHGGRAPITRDGEIEGLYYYQSRGLLVFYDKIKEQQTKKRHIPELYRGRNVLRYEQRYRSSLPKTFNVERVTGAMLYDEAFYMGVIDRWRDNYFNIKKINDINIKFEAMKTKRDLYTMGVLSLVESQGGELSILSQITEAQKTGILSKKQAFDLKKAVREACKSKTGLTASNEVILELDKKVKDAVRYYR
jgi:hypothetical protein